MSEQIITGIDVGTYQVKVAIVRVPKNKDERALPQIIGTGFAESRGLRNGYIINEADVHGIAQFSPRSAARWDPVRKEFADFDPPEQGHDISEFIWDYVARVPSVCELLPSPCNPTIVF